MVAMPALSGATKASDPRQRAVASLRVPFEQLYRLHREELFRHAMRLLRDEAAALDVVQETFSRALTAIEKITGELRARPWLFRITTNLCLKQLRRRRPLPLAEREHGLATGSPGSDPERAQQWRELGLQVEQALQRLPARYAQLLVLRELDGLSYDELKEVLGGELGQIKVMLHRARRRFFAEVRAAELLCNPATRHDLHCDGLRELLRELASHKALVRHLESCPPCASEKCRAYLALLPPIAAPAAWPSTTSATTGRRSSTARTALGASGLVALALAGAALWALAGPPRTPRQTSTPVMQPVRGTPSPPLHALPRGTAGVLAQRFPATPPIRRGAGDPAATLPGLRRRDRGRAKRASTSAVHASPLPKQSGEARRLSRRSAPLGHDAHPAHQGVLAVVVEPSFAALRVRRGGNWLRLRRSSELREGDHLRGRHFALRLPEHQWVAVSGSITLVSLPPKGGAPRLVTLHLHDGGLRARATGPGGGIALRCDGRHFFAATGLFRLRKAAHKLRLEALSAQVSQGTTLVMPGHDRVWNERDGSSVSDAPGRLLPAATRLRPVAFAGTESVQLSWQAVPDATAYRLRIARDTDFLRMVREQRLTALFHLPRPLPPGRYYWQIVAERDGQRGYPSKIYALRITAPH